MSLEKGPFQKEKRRPTFNHHFSGDMLVFGGVHRSRKLCLAFRFPFWNGAPVPKLSGEKIKKKQLWYGSPHCEIQKPFLNFTHHALPQNIPKLTWHLKMMVSNKNLHFQALFSGANCYFQVGSFDLYLKLQSRFFRSAHLLTHADLSLPKSYIGCLLVNMTHEPMRINPRTIPAFWRMIQCSLPLHQCIESGSRGMFHSGAPGRNIFKSL